MVNEETYNKYQRILDAKELVSSTQITHNFLPGILVRAMLAILNKNIPLTDITKDINFYTKIGEQNAGCKEIKDFYFTKDYLICADNFKEFLENSNFIRGCLVSEINKQFKLYCCGKRGRSSKR